jgi:hypothetical protein
VKDLREFQGDDGRLWQTRVEWLGGSRVLEFRTPGEARRAPYRDGWEEWSEKRLREILETESTPVPASRDDEGLHGLSDAPGG